MFELAARWLDRFAKPRDPPPVVQYDSQIIVQFAQRLYNQAVTTIAIYTIVGLLVGVFSSAGVGVVIALLGGNSFGSGAVTYMFMVAVLLVPFASGLAYLAGSQRAFALKLQAQTALCQVQIELSTRPQR